MVAQPYLPFDERFSPIRLHGFVGVGLANAATLLANVLKEAVHCELERFESLHEVGHRHASHDVA